MMSETYDLIVIGAGSGGLQAAGFGASLGANVALVEKGRIGGDCTWTGCIPSKALLHVAKTVHTARKAASFGTSMTPSRVDMGHVREYVQGVVGEIYARETPERLTEDGMEVISGLARFLDPQTIQVGDRKLSARRFIIATGARPMIPPIPGLAEVSFFTHEQIFENEQLPEHLMVLGAGPIGVEMAQAYARLGSRVTLVDVDVLPEEEPEVREVLERVFLREGIDCVRGLVTAVSQADGIISLYIGDGQEVVRGDMLLVATGRRPNIGSLDLDNADVISSWQGIKVDENLRTSSRNIFAVGDCLGGPQFTHLAAWQGYKAARNALLPGNSPGKYGILPRTTFTDPEIARVGLSETAAREQYGDQVRVTRRNMALVDRAVTDDARDGFIKIVHKKDGSLLGATIVASNAGELIAEYVLGLQHKLKIGDLAGAMHVYPTFSMGTQALTADIATEVFLESVTGKLLCRLNGYDL